MRAKIDINEVETRTKIRAKYLRAMENEEWDLLPGEVYARSFLRTYGDFLGLDSRQLLDEFRRETESPSDHEPPPIAPPSRRERDRAAPRRGVPPWAIIGAVLVVVVVVLYVVGTANKSSTKRSTTPRNAQASRRQHQVRRTRHRTTTDRAPAKPKVVRLSLVATGQVYVCLVNGSGRKLIPGQIYNVGQPIPVQTAATLLLTLGNNQVTMKANGVTIPVAASASSIGFRFTPGTHAPLPSAQQPSCT